MAASSSIEGLAPHGDEDCDDFGDGEAAAGFGNPWGLVIAACSFTLSNTCLASGCRLSLSYMQRCRAMLVALLRPIYHDVFHPAGKQRPTPQPQLQIAGTGDLKFGIFDKGP
eukprot:1018914-Alexandrium_andersonii.AAC.2